ncbi:MAG: hypothetical protein DWH94_09995 [Planctomycetota bacterium]|nr:MAG: hypothetical protein DWH94_09995 [Planctomycetota bacterium]
MLPQDKNRIREPSQPKKKLGLLRIRSFEGLLNCLRDFVQLMPMLGLTPKKTSYDIFSETIARQNLLSRETAKKRSEAKSF